MFILGIILLIILLSGGKAFADEFSETLPPGVGYTCMEHVCVSESFEPTESELDEETLEAEPELEVDSSAYSETSPAAAAPRMESPPAVRVPPRIRRPNRHVHCKRNPARSRTGHKGRAGCRAVRKAQRP
jgi:hypothetical protein